MNRFVKTALTFAGLGLVAACSDPPIPAPDSTASPRYPTSVTVVHMATVDGMPVSWFCDGQDKIVILDKYRGIAAMPNHPDCPAVRAHPSGVAK